MSVLVAGSRNHSAVVHSVKLTFRENGFHCIRFSTITNRMHVCIACKNKYRASFVTDPPGVQFYRGKSGLYQGGKQKPEGS